MPGFEPDRFFNNSDTYLEEFKCGICHGIFIKPVVTNCCQQTYCADCINEWLKHRTTCPNDRRPLTAQQLRPTSRPFLNLLNKLNINCNYRSEGCLSIVKISDLENHIKECEFRPNTVCKVCHTLREKVLTHNCIESLMIENNKIMAKNEKILGTLVESNKAIEIGLEKQKNNFKRKIDSLNEEFQIEMKGLNKQMNEMSSKFQKRLDSLKLENNSDIALLKNDFKNRNQPIYQLKTQNQNQIIIEARQHLNKSKLVKSSLYLSPIQQQLIEIIQEALLNISNNSFKALSTYILEKANKFARFTECQVYDNVNQNNRPSESIINRSTFIIQFGKIEIMFLSNRVYEPDNY